MALTGRINLQVSIDESKTADFATPHWAIDQAYTWAITSGTASGQADLQFSDQRTLSAGANEDLDLAGVLSSIYGTTLTLVKLKMVILKAADANPNAMTFSRPASNGVVLFGAASDNITLPPGATFVWMSPLSGVTVTAATGDLLNVLAGAGGNHTYDVFILGTSA